MSKFRIVIADWPDKEELVAEIIYDHVHWVEISEEVIGEYKIQFYNHPEEDCWEFSWDEAMEALQKAKDRLSGMERIDPDS